MNANALNGLSAVKQYLHIAQDKENQSHLIFLDKHKDVWMVSEDNNVGDDIVYNLFTQAKAYGPTFEILSIVNGAAWILGGKAIYGPVTLT